MTDYPIPSEDKAYFECYVFEIKRDLLCIAAYANRTEFNIRGAETIFALHDVFEDLSALKNQFEYVMSELKACLEEAQDSGYWTGNPNP